MGLGREEKDCKRKEFEVSMRGWIDGVCLSDLCFYGYACSRKHFAFGPSGSISFHFSFRICGLA